MPHLTAALALGQQSASIQGTIRDVDFDEPAAGARAEIVELGKSAQADARGAYVFSGLPAGSYTVVFSGPGFSSEVVEVVLEEGALEIVDAELTNNFTEIDKFVFEPPMSFGGAGEIGLLNLRFEAPSLIDSVGGELLSQASVGSADEALGLVSGATVSADSTPVIRGLPDRFVSSQVNGVRLPSANEDKRAVELDQFPRAVIESIQVSKTFTPDQQGDASGGAVNLVLNRIPDKPIFNVSAQTSYNTQVTNEQGFLSYRGGGVGALGLEADERPIQALGENWSGAVGVSPSSAPTDYKFSTALGGGRDLDEAVPCVRGAFFPDAVLHLEPEFWIPVAQEVAGADEHGLAVSLPAGHAKGDLDDAPVDLAVLLGGGGVGGRGGDSREHRAAGTLRGGGTKGSRWHHLAARIFFISRVRDPRRERRASGACGGHDRWPSRTFEPRTEEVTRGCLSRCAAPASGYERRLARSQPLVDDRFHDTGIFIRR